MPSVFISSTYEDLKEHRESVASRLRQAELVAIDMIDFGARPQGASEVCFKEIHDADFFVGIYAYRYGYIPDGESISITEAEFRHAEKLEKPILCYIVREDYPWQKNFRSRGQSAEQLASFKAYIGKNWVRDTFTTPDNLAAKVMADLSREMKRAHSGQRIITNKTTTEDILGILGLDPHALAAAEAKNLKIMDSIKEGITVAAGDLRSWLLRGGYRQLPKPRPVNIDGVLQPYALMHSGWWETEDEDGKSSGKKSGVRGLREWLLFGLQEWAPSWGYAWSMSESGAGVNRPFHLGQIADEMCDEAESIPVYIPADKAAQLTAEFLENPGGLNVTLTGIIVHRKHFCPLSLAIDHPEKCMTCEQGPECLVDQNFGGALDYCIVVDANEPSHGIVIKGPAEFYSGYLWTCLVPKNIVSDVSQASKNDSFFVWEHTNFADPEAVAFNLDSLERKRTYLEAKHGPMYLVQKSSVLVPGTPEVASDIFYQRLLRGPRKRI